MKVHTITSGIVPTHAQPHTVYHFPADSDALAQYGELTDRTRGWFTPSMITTLSKSRVAIAGVGGIGGHVADSLVRAGIGHISIADPGVFDYSNIHRQHGAAYTTVGASKTLATTSSLLNTVSSTSITAYPMGICTESITQFLSGVDIIVDAIEFHAIGSRCLLHKVAREKGIPILNGNSVGFGTRLFLFSPQGGSLLSAFPFDENYAHELEKKFLSGSISEKEYFLICQAILRVFLPDIPNYGNDTDRAFIDRLMYERTASIISTNPKMAAGILSNQLLLSLTEKQCQLHAVSKITPFPEYYQYDFALRHSGNYSLNISKIYHELLAHMHS